MTLYNIMNMAYARALEVYATEKRYQELVPGEVSDIRVENAWAVLENIRDLMVSIRDYPAELTINGEVVVRPED